MPYVRFHLLVTGKGERDFVGRFLGSILEGYGATFMQPEFVGQFSPRAEHVRELKEIGTVKNIPTKLETKVTIQANTWLRKDPHCFVILIDDLESSRSLQAKEIFAYYRSAIDKALSPEMRARASVHFFVNMLEAYYFAHADAVNAVIDIGLVDVTTDVESIDHPKNTLKKMASAIGKTFDEKADGEKIVEQLDLDKILGDSQNCRALRTLVGWCRHRLGAEFSSRWRLVDGDFHPLTCGQIPWAEKPPS